MKAEFIELLSGVDREGIHELIDWLENETDFFSAPASTQFHGNFDGGLLVHSLMVYKYLKNFTKMIDTTEDTLRVIGLLHDLCKVNFFIRQIKNVKVPGEKRWIEEETYGIDDKLPMGHGEKSVYLAMRFIKLSEEEALAIRWHMGGYDDAVHSYISAKAQSSAFRTYPVAAALNIADMYVTYIMDQ